MNLLSRCAALAALSFVGATAFAAEIPAKVFAQLPQYGTMALSPNGKLLAITTPVDNRTDLMIVDLSGKAEPKRVRYMPNEHVVSPFWVDDERLVVSKAEKLGALAQPRGRGELYSLDANGENQEMLFGYVPDNGAVQSRERDAEVRWQYAEYHGFDHQFRQRLFALSEYPVNQPNA